MIDRQTLSWIEGRVLKVCKWFIGLCDRMSKGYMVHDKIFCGIPDFELIGWKIWTHMTRDFHGVCRRNSDFEYEMVERVAAMFDVTRTFTCTKRKQSIIIIGMKRSSVIRAQSSTFTEKINSTSYHEACVIMCYFGIVVLIVTHTPCKIFNPNPKSSCKFILDRPCTLRNWSLFKPRFIFPSHESWFWISSYTFRKPQK